MEDYLARNIKLLKEISASALLHPLKAEGKEVGANERNHFVTLGAFQSSEQGIIHAGLKLPIFGEFGKNDLNGFYTSLTNLALIDNFYPESAGRLPLFYGILFDPDNKARGIITEDFSKGNKYEVKAYQDKAYQDSLNVYLPWCVVDIFYKREMNMYGIGLMEGTLFYVDGKAKIGDLDHILPNAKYEKVWGKMRAKAASLNQAVNFTKVPLDELFPDESERNYANLVLNACLDGPKEHIELINANLERKIKTSTELNRVLYTLVDNWYLKMLAEKGKDLDSAEKIFELP
jgi:hypothetical protein